MTDVEQEFQLDQQLDDVVQQSLAYYAKHQDFDLDLLGQIAFLQQEQDKLSTPSLSVN